MLKTMHIRHKIYRNQADNELETSSLLARFHNAETGYAAHWGRKSVSDPTWKWILWISVPNCQSSCACLRNSGLTVMQVTTYSLIGFGVHSTSRNSCLVVWLTFYFSDRFLRKAVVLHRFVNFFMFLLYAFYSYVTSYIKEKKNQQVI